MKKIGISLVFAITSIIHADPNTLKIPSIGLEITKPEKWFWGTSKENSENLSKIELKDNIQDSMAKYSSAPLAIIYKHKEPHDDLNPSFKINIKPYGSMEGKTGSEILGVILPLFRTMFNDFEILIGPIDTTINGNKSGYLKINYLLKTKEGAEFPTCSELWVILKKDFYYLAGAGTRQDEKSGKREEIYEIIKGAKF